MLGRSKVVDCIKCRGNYFESCEALQIPKILVYTFPIKRFSFKDAIQAHWIYTCILANDSNQGEIVMSSYSEAEVKLASFLWGLTIV
jgi:hypothetical protein